MLDTKSQGPKKKCTRFIRMRIHSCSVDTSRNYQGSFTSMALWSVQSFLSTTVFYNEITYFLIFSDNEQVIGVPTKNAEIVIQAENTDALKDQELRNRAVEEDLDSIEGSIREYF